jgi:CRISPR-associated protein Cas2
MYIILVYDVNVKRTTKVMKLCRQYLSHIQNSVFEGEISDSNFKELKMKLNKGLNKKEDSIIIYQLYLDKYAKKEILGKNKNDTSNFI